MAPKTMFHNRRPPFKPTSRDTITPSTSQESGPPSSTTVSATPSPSQGQDGATTPQPRPPRPPRRRDDDTLPPPEGPFAEFRLVSSSLKGWKYDVMKFDSRKPVDITTWSRPVKLNRKETRRPPGGADGATPQPVAVGPMLGPDMKPVIGADGKIVMVDAEGRPIRPGQTQANGSGGGGSGGAAAAAVDGPGAKGKDKDRARKRFQKKTKQVFLVPDEVRQLRREERYPWVVEDGTGQEVWLAAMEEVSKAKTQAMFMPTATDVFKFVPAHRWYKFQKKPNYHIPDLEEAETLMNKIQKNKDPERWFLRNKNGQGPSEETKAMFKNERSASVVPSGSSLVHSAGESLGPGGRRLKAVDSGMAGLFGEDDEDGVDSGKRKQREYGAEGDLDEIDFEEDFQDDDEKAEPDVDDEEAKELEERLKREYKTANKTRDGAVDESDEEEDGQQLTGAGKDMRKLMKKLEKNNGYDDSDDEKNPYASSEEEPEEEVPVVPQGPAIIAPEARPGSRSTSQAPSASPGGTKTPATQAGAEPGSRATSPVPPPGHGGHSVVAKRATSPNGKMPKLKANGTSRAGSPLAGGSRATSPAGSPTAGRADSPAQSPTLGSSSPTFGSAKPSNKRKAEDAAAGAGAASKPKKRKAQVAVNGELEDWMVVEWLRQTPNATTRDCIHHFTPYLKTEEKKQAFTKLVKEVAQLKNGVLVLRNMYRTSGGAPSPGPGAE